MSATMSQMSTAVTQWAGNVASNVNNRNKVKNPIGFCAKCVPRLAMDPIFVLPVGHQYLKA